MNVEDERILFSGREIWRIGDYAIVREAVRSLPAHGFRAAEFEGGDGFVELRQADWLRGRAVQIKKFGRPAGLAAGEGNVAVGAKRIVGSK